jgi:hypothetical protein
MLDERISEFRRVRAILLDVLDQYPDDRVDEVLFDEWSLKSVVAHLSGWDRYFTDILRDLESGRKALYWGSIQEFNEGSVAHRIDLNWSDVYKEFIEAGEAFIESYRQASPSLVEEKFWANRSYTPAEILEVNIHHYAESHLPQLEAGLAIIQRSG